MKRSAPLRRTTRLRPVSQNGRVSGRPSLARGEYAALRTLVRKRARGRCEVCGRRGTDVAHILSRARGGPDRLASLAYLCRNCHAREDVPNREGKLLLFRRDPDDRLDWVVTFAADKWALRR